MNSTEPDTNRTALAGRIFRARVAAGLTKSQVAARCGVSARTVQYWERGERRPSSHLLRPLAEVTGQPVAHFLDAYPEPNGAAAA